MNKPKPSTNYSIEAFPESMVNAARWVCWKPVERDGKWTKIPWSAVTGNPASSTDPSTWCGLVTASEYADEHGYGLGFMLGDGWLGVDFDGVAGPKWTWRDEWVGDWTARAKTYLEWSPSGTGIHAICRGTVLPEWSQNRRGPVEVYQAARFFCMTGDSLFVDRDAVNAQAAVDEVCDRFLRREEPARAVPSRQEPSEPSAAVDASAEDWRLSCALAAQGFGREEIARYLTAKMVADGRGQKAARRDYVERTVDGAIRSAGETEAETAPSIVPLESVIVAHPEKTPYVIDRLLRQGEVGAVIAPPKCRKSFLMHDLGLSVATGCTWLGGFRTNEGRVLIVDNELTANEIADRTRTILGSRNWGMDAIRGRVDILSLREDDRGLDSVLRGIAALEQKYALIVFDALYMFLEKGMDENSNADMTVLLRRFRRFATSSGSAVLLVHHTAKGSANAAREVMDLGAGAGALGRAVDLNIGIYRHEEDGAFVMKFQTRSSAPVEDFGIRWRYPRFEAAVGLDCEELYTGRKRKSD